MYTIAVVLVTRSAEKHSEIASVVEESSPQSSALTMSSDRLVADSDIRFGRFGLIERHLGFDETIEEAFRAESRFAPVEERNTRV